MAAEHRCTALTLLAVAVSACADDIVRPAGPADLSPIPASHLALTSGSRVTPNAIKYRNSGVQPAKGRSGNATLEVRALAGRDGATLVEATTGSLEAGTSRGNIDKTQVKILVGNTPARNYNGLRNGGYWSTSYLSLVSGDHVRVQANVSGIDRRVDVVTATTQVARRPDIAVTSLLGPDVSSIDSPVTFSATLLEQNGDVGARANCVLSVDGVAVDEATDIWVDAGSTVNCMFDHTFGDAGTYAVQVSATEVNPGDWDTSNNSAEILVKVKGAGDGPVQIASLQLEESNMGWEYRALNTGGSLALDDHEVGTRRYSAAYLFGEDRVVEDASDVDRFDATITADGVVNRAVSLTPTATSSSVDRDWSVRCVAYSNDVWVGEQLFSSGDLAHSCVLVNIFDPSIVRRTYLYQHISGVVIYYGRSFACTRLDCYTSVWNNDFTYASGISFGWTLASIVRVQADFVLSSGTTRPIDLSASFYDNSDWIPISVHRCDPDGIRGGTTCVDRDQFGTQLLGAASY
jgi:hypothetical protein